MKIPALAAVSFAALLSCAPWTAKAAEPNADSSAKSGPVFAQEIILAGDTTLKTSNSEYKHVSFYHLNWGINQVVPAGTSGTFTVGLNYSLSGRYISEPAGWEDDDDWDAFKQTHPDWKRVPIPKQLQALSTSIEYAQTINDRWALNASVCAGSYVASKGLLSKGRGVSTSAMALYKWSPSINLAMGAAYDSLSHDYRLVPLLGFDWQLNEKWSIAIGFPSTSVTYVLNHHFTFALDVSGSGGTYYVENDPAPGTAPLSLGRSKLETTEIRVGLKSVWKINETFSVSATTGQVLYQEFKYIDRGYKLKSHNMAGFASLSGSISF